MLERVGWRRKEGGYGEDDGEVLSSFAFARKSNCAHFFCSIFWLHLVSKK